ncbi:hypothetical protein QJ043_00730 [Olsenella sp. YH-ols2217]|uniref:Type II toxin-antitoxin system RelE/ParE family toxin n=1 Tax=Kribbibacterium absianum TaxID=3044210 RepID=A0ABT6ZHT6_9ACTN|nr:MULTISPECIES: hypothetical protein [unclassified Olsenella]MDJ1121121.1 hypothetical protein [Olsenella sp. YH-ols2216]MDJ1128612.1 hypothetical protein [Olsenella sp. YH-ols2217]
MAGRAVWSPEALQGWFEVLDYRLEQAGSESTRSLSDAPAGRVALIVQQPELYGFSRLPELRALGVRASFVENCVILYRAGGASVAILLVADARIDYAAHVRGAGQD